RRDRRGPLSGSGCGVPGQGSAARPGGPAQTHHLNVKSPDQRSGDFSLCLSLIPVRVLALPVPAVSAHFLNAVLSFPAQLLLGLGGVGVALRNVSGTAGVNYIGQLPAASLAESVDH